MDRHYHLFPAHTHQCTFHSATYAPELVRLCDVTWILTRHWRYSVASGGCSKHDNPLTATPMMQPSQSVASRRPVRMTSRSNKTAAMIRNVRRRPIRRISWALNLGLHRNLPALIILIKYRSSRAVEILWRWPRGLWLWDSVCCALSKILLMAPCVIPVIRAISTCRHPSRESLTMQAMQEIFHLKYVVTLSEPCKIEIRRSFQPMEFEWI